jgi:hypothetical protein
MTIINQPNEMKKKDKLKQIVRLSALLWGLHKDERVSDKAKALSFELLNLFIYVVHTINDEEAFLISPGQEPLEGLRNLSAQLTSEILATEFGDYSTTQLFHGLVEDVELHVITSQLP